MTQIIESTTKVEYYVLCTMLIPFSVLFYSNLNPYKKAVKQMAFESSLYR